MIKCALEKETTDIIFTYMTQQGDWLKLNKEPHIHYIIKPLK
jgi:hypothetical protein